jgi:cation transport protein ChaC
VTETPDPFRHVPALRELIAPPQTSQYRKLDFDRLDGVMATNGFTHNWRRSHEERETTRAEALAGRLDGDLWVFAYGSLMWDPAIQFSEVWQREMIMPGYAPTFMTMKTPQGEIEALAFVVMLDGPHYLPDITLEEAAPMIATARGFFGSNLEYLDNLAEHFQTIDIHDEDFVRLYELAREIAVQAR